MHPSKGISRCRGRQIINVSLSVSSRHFCCISYSSSRVNRSDAVASRSPYYLSVPSKIRGPNWLQVYMESGDDIPRPPSRRGRQAHDAARMAREGLSARVMLQKPQYIRIPNKCWNAPRVLHTCLGAELHFQTTCKYETIRKSAPKDLLINKIWRYGLGYPTRTIVCATPWRPFKTTP